MSPLRNALRCIFFALVFTAPLSAYAVNYDVRVFFDTDSNRATGCTIPTANGPVAGVEQVLTTSVTVNGGTGTVTGVTRQVCVNGLFFGDPVPVNGGWNVGVSPTGNLFIETHVGANVMTIANISTMRLAFTVTSSGGLTDAMTSDFGDDILYPVRPSRRHAVSTGALRTIHLDGVDTDWAGVATLASGDAASPALRFLDASAYADISDLFFNFRIQTNANAPTALDDFYALGTVGGTLSVSTLGVLNNDSDPNHLSLSAFLVEGPEHGTLALNANGGFTYTHDGSSFFEDHFRYRVTNGTLESNLATVTISLPGSHPYTFTSADHVTFTAGQLNTFHVTVTGNPTPALSEDGVLPSGITFTDNGDGTGTLSGTPAAGTVGTYPIVFHAEKNKPHQTDQNFTLTVVCSAITVTNPVVNTGTINTPFSQTFTQSGGAAPITWSKTGALPAGLTFNTSTGVLSGTPTQGGTFPITVTATDASGCTGTGPTYTLTILCNSITVTNPGTTSGTVNVAFSQTFTQSGGVGTTTFSLASGTLPAGLTLNPSTGVLSGTPTQKGSFPIVVRATDSHGCSGDGSTYPLNIGCQVISVTNPGTNTGTVNVAFSQTFTSGNAIAPVVFSLNSGTLPAGITLNASTGVLSGTPTQTGSFPISIKVTDANGCFGIGTTYTLTISCQIITVTNPGTNTGTVNVAFSQTFTAGNAIAPVTFSLNSGSLPAGITLNASTGVLSGTPTQTGSFPITIKATDANGCFGIGATYTLTIGCQVITVNNPGTNSGTVNAAFSQTFTAGNTIGATTFTTASTLPTGLTLSTAGVLSGTPTQTGVFPIVVHVVDANGCSGNGSTYTLTINCQVITVTNPATTTGIAGTPFSQIFTQTGGFGATTFSISSGTLPAGMTLHSATGVLDGTPTQVGSFPIVVRATDANGCTGDGATYTLVIACQTITVTNPLTTTGTAGTPFSQTFTQSGGIGTTTFSTASTLPTGLTLHSATGVLDGTPTQVGSFPIVVTATDSNGCTGSGSTYTLVIGCQTITVTNPATTTGIAGTAFSQTFTQSSAIGGATFTLNSGTLPAGLTLHPNGVLDGTPTVVGSFPITVKVTDGNNCTGVGSTYTLVIGCQTITVTNPVTTTGTIQVAFSQTFTQSGAIGGATFSINSGTLPAGLTLHSTTGVLDGTPTVTGSFPISVLVTDGNGCTGVGASYNLVINCQTITVTNPATTTGTVSAPFTQIFTQSGANGTATFTTASTLPAGLSLATDGTLSGTPTQPGTFPIVVTVTDSNGCTGTSPTYTLIIGCQTITVTNPAVNSGAAGAPFSQTFTQVGGIGTITWSESGALPTGLTFHTGTGVLDGTPTGSGSFPITVTATDSNGCTGTGPTYTLTITCPTITVTNPGVSTGTAGTAFSQTFTQSGGQGTITWSETGALPSGISLNSASGVLSGTTSQVGTFPITVTATDVNSCTGTGATYNLTFNCQTISITNPGVNTGTVDAAFCQTFTATGILGTATWSETGALPSGITLNSSTGALCGTPGQPGSFPITVKVTDTNGCFSTSSYTLTINCQTITVTKPGVTTGTVDAPFSQTFTQSGVGTHTPATFTLNSGSLPSGLTLSTAGVLSGTPGQQGSFPITVKVTDANGCFGVSTTYTLNIACQTITVTNPATTTGTVAVAFSQTFTQSGVGTHTPATFTTASTLPTGFSLSTAGVLSGTTNQHGTFPIVVTVTDANGCTGTGATYNLVINCQTITVTNPGVTTGTVGTPFGQTFTQTGANGGATFTTASTLPTGLSLDSAGLLSGTPLQAGSFPIVVTVTDGNGCTGTGPTYTLVIACNVISVTNPGVTTGTVDAAFSQTFTQSGGNGTITWSKTGAIPAGMTFHAATGVLDGTPSVPGSFPITVTATDSNGCTGTGPTYTLVIACQTITVNNPGVTTGTVDAAFSQTFTQSGVGTHTPATFTINSGSLPSGLSLSTAGVLSGTPGQPGSFPITVKVTDANGCTGISATYTLVIACQTITVTNPATTSGVFNTAFSQTFTQSGVGTHTPATFTINSGTLPTGLSLSTAGVLSGTPTQTGTFPITVKVTDANGCTGISATYNLAITPSIGADSYSNLVDNTQAVVTGGATASPGTPFVTLTGSVLANDLPAGGVSVTAGTSPTSAGGSVTILSDGTFIYTPKANPGGAVTTLDTFTYTGSSNTGATATPTTATATVTLNLAGRVWYVKNNGGGTNGQSQSPFTTLAAAAAASTANDIIFVYNGDGTNSGQNAGISLKNGQQLLGEVNGLIVNAQTLVAVGSRPTIGNSGGDGVTVAATAASLTGVFIKGFSIAGTANGINLNSSGANTLTATVDNVVITNATANNGIKIAGASTTTTTATVQNSTVSAATQNGIDAQQTSAGNLVLSINNDNVTATGTGINVNGTGSTSTSITNFANNNINGNTGGSGIVVTSATFDAVPGTVAFDVVSGGNTVIGASGNGVGAAGMVLNTVKGDLSFTDLDIFTSNGGGLVASSAATFNSGAGTGFQIVSTGTPTIDATGGPAADLTTVTANLPFVTIKSATSASTGVSLATVLGTFTAGVGSTITNATGIDFNITGGTATVTYDGTISDASGRPVSISGATGGTKSFTGAITNNGGTGISLTSNTGATINFSGNLTLSTGSSTAFNATGGGTVTATNTSSTAATTTGTAVNIANTTIGAGGVKFLSVSSNGAANGINLNTTGAGAFTVIGDGGAANNGSGGTIQNTTAEGILTNSTGTISLGYLNVTNSGTKGISVTGSTGVTINRCNVTDNAGGATDEGLNLINNTGTITLSDDVVDSAPHNQVNIDNNNTNITAINVTNSTFKCTAGNTCQPSGSVGADGLVVQIRGTSVLTSANVQGCTVTGNRSTGIQVSAADTATIGSSSGGTITAPAASHSFVVQSNTLSNNNAGIDMDKSQTSNITFEILSNTLTFHKAESINAFSGTGVGFGGTITGYINGNQIGIQGTKDSGSTSNGNGIRMIVQGDTTQGFLTADGNTIREVPNADVIVAFSQKGGNTGGASCSARFKITNNTLPQPSGTNQSLGCGAGVPCGAADGNIFVLVDDGSTGCALISGNNIFDATTMNGSWDVYLATRTGPPTGASMTIQTGANGGNSAAALTFINGNNTLNGANKSNDESGNATTVTSCGSFPP